MTRPSVEDAASAPPAREVRPALGRSSLLNLAGLGAPLAAGLVAIPILVRALGTDRFGVLALAWTITSYFSAFDLGLGRALTSVIASRVAGTGERVAPQVAWTSLGLLLALGIVGAAALHLVAPRLATEVLVIPQALQEESRRAFQILALCIPFVVITAGFVGVLTAFEEFGRINLIRGPMGMLVLLAPVLVLPFGRNLVPVAWSLVAVRGAAAVGMALACWRRLPRPGARPAGHDPLGLRALVSFGAWVTVTNIVSPILVYLDRFLIAGMLSVGAVAFYATPYEVVTKAFILPAALAGALFPAFASSVARDMERMRRLFRRGSRYMALIIFPLMLVAIGLAHEGLDLWLGAEFAERSTPVLQWIALGVFVNCIGQVFFTLVQGAGRPDISAKFHLLELPLYILLLVSCIRAWGITGAAIAWTLRVTFDAALLLVASGRLLGLPARALWRVAGLLAAGAMALAVPMLVDALAARLAITVSLGGAFVLLAWRLWFGADERVRLREAFR